MHINGHKVWMRGRKRKRKPVLRIVIYFENAKKSKCDFLTTWLIFTDYNVNHTLIVFLFTFGPISRLQEECRWGGMKRGSSYRQITQKKGGGIVFQDINKKDTFQEFLQKITSSFFPNGLNTEQNLRLDNFDYFMANFTGVSIKLVSPNGDPIHVGTFIKSVSTSPLRIYFHTQPKVRVKNYLTTFNCLKLFTFVVDTTFLLSDALPALRQKFRIE